ncbi:hypothetical protein Dvar_26260 [Desulfosarcina variabilis str. Montpellier]|uniref:glycosyltransferase n=1 Tax=Desulfosarcina variabilis TaxID=2300 RepID=UPI003AFA5C5B
MKKIYWIDINRFDKKIDKSTWLEVSEYLINHGYDVVLLTGYMHEKYVPFGYHVDIKYFKAFNLPFFFKISLSLTIFFWLFKNIKNNDIIIISPLSLFYCAITNFFKKLNIHLDIRTIPVEIHSVFDHIDYFLHWYLQLKFFKTIPNSYSFITYLLQKHIEKEFNTSFKNTVIWNSGVDFGRFKPVKDFLPLNNKKYLVTYIGVVTRNRGLDTVIKSLKNLNGEFTNKIRFQIIGSGNYLENLKELTTSLNLEDIVLFKGYLPYEKIPEALMDSDCFISPLPNRPEWEVSSPIKIFEYIACGRPIILTPIAAHKVIQNTNCSIIWTNGFNSEDFKLAFEYTYKNRIKMRKSAKSLSSNYQRIFSWNYQANKLYTFLKRFYG